MDQVVKLVQEKTGISEEQAREAVQTVLGFLKERLPQPIAGQLDSFVSGDAGSNPLGGLGNLGGLGG